ncbi:MAG: glycosyltransferase family 1 protein [Candidatus Magasanikbacteria bacterium]|nr:glycosyltransferase family 1 protein [Candidatus Magasanikbacteria bacterium]
MKIGIDARMLGPKQGGIGRYVEQLVKHLTAADQSHDFFIFLRKENWDLVKETPNVKKVLADIHWYGWREQLLLPGIIKREKIDLMHFPHWNIPLLYRGKFLVTIHDLLLLHYPTRAASTLGPAAYFFKNIAYRIILRHAIKNSKHIIAPSEFTKNDIIKFFKVGPEKITVTHLAPMPLDSRLRGNDNKNIFPKITKPYVLYVGVAYPHKNLEGLIEAWKMFCAEHGNDYQLVLAGRKNFFYEKLEQSTTAPGIIFTDYLPDEDLPALYQGASLYVFPSFYEGFGLPPLEAMQYGVPVASSNATCLPEILNEAAAYFDPRDPTDIAATIWRVLTDLEMRETLTKNGVQLIHNYSWEKAAKTTLEVFNSVL